MPEALGESEGSPGPRFEHGLRGGHLSFCSDARYRTAFCESREVRKGLSGDRRSGESDRLRVAWLTRGLFSVWSVSSSGAERDATRGLRREGGWRGRMHQVWRPRYRCVASPPTRQGAFLLCEQHAHVRGSVTSLAKAAGTVMDEDKLKIDITQDRNRHNPRLRCRRSQGRHATTFQNHHTTPP